jgi:hypothetical protein
LIKHEGMLQACNLIRFKFIITVHALDVSGALMILRDVVARAFVRRSMKMFIYQWQAVVFL